MEPNIKNAKSKLSTWNNFDNTNKAKKGTYVEQFKVWKESSFCLVKKSSMNLHSTKYNSFIGPRFAHKSQDQSEKLARLTAQQSGATTRPQHTWGQQENEKRRQTTQHKQKASGQVKLRSVACRCTTKCKLFLLHRHFLFFIFSLACCFAYKNSSFQVKSKRSLRLELEQTTAAQSAPDLRASQQSDQSQASENKRGQSHVREHSESEQKSTQLRVHSQE